MIDWSSVFSESHSYNSFLDRHATPAQKSNGRDAMHKRFKLTADQVKLLGGFTRRMPVVCLAGALVRRLRQPVSRIRPFRCLLAADRPAISRPRRHQAVRDALAINGGQRVPVVVFLSEDWNEVFHYGERTLSIYRRMAADQLGPACPTGLVPPLGGRRSFP